MAAVQKSLGALVYRGLAVSDETGGITPSQLPDAPTPKPTLLLQGESS